MREAGADATLSPPVTEPRLPTSTYRLQFNRHFTFAQAREIVPYLHSFGIGDVYASPYFQARAESLHGYDITDHNKLNAAIGSREEYDAFVDELHAHDMGQVLDFVPNHMGVGEPHNQWWMDVLENGPSSTYAPYFDIDWHPLKSDLHDKVLLPILGDQYGRVLERGELKVRFEAGAFYLNYYDHEWPIAPGTYRHILEIALENLEPYKDEDFYAEFQSIITGLENLPRRNETDPERMALRAREKEIIKRRLDRRCQEAPQVREAIEKAVEQINGTPGDARSFDALDEFLNDQAYRLAFWRVAAEEINYRRFFDINDLAAIRMELPEVFDATHQLLLELVRQKAVTGLRIDHPDGLYLPERIFREIAASVARTALGISLPADGRAIYLVVEKILTGHERLPNDWPVHGTTGYEFARIVNNLLCDASAEQAMTKTYPAFHRPFDALRAPGLCKETARHAPRRFRTTSRSSATCSIGCRKKTAGSAISRSISSPWPCAKRSPAFRFTGLTSRADGKVSEEDRAVIERAVAAAKRRNPGDRGIGLQFPARHFAFPFSGKSRRRDARGARAFRFEVSAVHRPDHGEGARGHDVLHFQ